MKSKINLSESRLRNIVAESVKKVLKEYHPDTKKDPMKQWYKDMDDAQKVRDTMDYVTKGGKNPNEKKGAKSGLKEDEGNYSYLLSSLGSVAQYMDDWGYNKESRAIENYIANAMSDDDLEFSDQILKIIEDVSDNMSQRMAASGGENAHWDDSDDFLRLLDSVRQDYLNNFSDDNPRYTLGNVGINGRSRKFVSESKENAISKRLRQIVSESIRKVLNEGPESDGYEYGIEPDYALRRGFEDTKEKGKNYFANNGIVNFGFNKNPEHQVKIYITTCFLANRRLAGKLGAKWGTAASKRVFNAYTVDSDSILAVIEDRRNNNIFQVQIKDGEPVLAADANDKVVDLKQNYKYGTILTQLRHYFKWNFEATKKMTAEEDEFFAGKTSKTYDRLR